MRKKNYIAETFFLNSDISRSIMMKDSVKNEANLISSNYANFNQRCSISVVKG